MCRNFLSALVLVGVLASPSFAQPANIVLIRHGEKDATKPTDVGLTWQGKARAAALVPYFDNFFGQSKTAPPSFIFAQSAPEGHSQRPILTITPYANSLKLDDQHFITTKYKSGDYCTLVKELLDPANTQYAGKTVLICWEHNNLAAMANCLITQLTGSQYQVNSAADLKWPGGDVYGLTWTFAIDPANKKAIFVSTPQQLMYDDAGTTLKHKDAKRAE